MGILNVLNFLLLVLSCTLVIKDFNFSTKVYPIVCYFINKIHSLLQLSNLPGWQSSFRKTPINILFATQIFSNNYICLFISKISTYLELFTFP